MAGRPGLIARVADVNRTRRPEHDTALRVRILAAVCTSVVAVAVAGAAPVAQVVAVLVLLPVGFAWSHAHRTSANSAAKLVVSVLALAALYRFFTGVLGIGTIDDARLPLTVMFLDIQVLHSFDLPQRRDLVFTLSSSLALTGLAVAGGPGAALIPVVLVYLVLAGASLQRYQRSVEVEWLEGASRRGTTAVPAAARTPGGRWWALRYAAALLGVATLVFVSVPLRSDASLAGLPFEFGRGGPQAADGTGRVGGDLPFDESDGGGSRDADPLEYFGFAERVDPRSSAELSDTPVLRVRTNRPRPLRGVVFDLYADGVWGRTEDLPEPRQGLPVRIDGASGPRSRTTRVTQTIELLRPTPNLVFAAEHPVEVWTAARSATPWTDGTITTSVEMDEGTVYSVVSAVDVTPFDVLRTAPPAHGDADPAAFARWTQLPDTVPDRVHALAATLAGQVPGGAPFAVAESIQSWLGANVSYRLGADPADEDEDPVDHLLFDSGEGWCEPIATAMVVMLRSVGIPARFVTGFQPGDRDVLSGRYVVRASDAHAWVEAFVPGHGWVPFDPTGATTPVLDPDGAGTQILLLDLLRAAADRLPDDPAVVGGAGVGAAVLLGAALVARRRLAARRLHAAGPWAVLVHRLREEGLDHDDARTPAEVVAHARRALPHLDPVALDDLRAHEEARRYGGGPEPDRGPAQEALSRL